MRKTTMNRLDKCANAARIAYYGFDPMPWSELSDAGQNRWRDIARAVVAEARQSDAAREGFAQIVESEAAGPF